MKKWLILIAFLLLMIVVSIDLILDIREDRLNGMVQAQRFVTELTGWKVLSGTRYHGPQLYFIFTMEDNDRELHYVVVDEDFHLRDFPHKDLAWTEEEIRMVVHNHYPGWKIEAIRPAFVNQGMCWEIVASDEQNRFHYLYYGMADGQFIKRYSLENSLRY